MVGPGNEPTCTISEQVSRRAIAGDIAALAEVFDHHRDRLRRLVQLRLDRRLKGRIDASDVLQEAYLEMARGVPQTVRQHEMPLFVWLRMVTASCLARAHRCHLATAGRDASLEISLNGQGAPMVGSSILAEHLVNRFTSVDGRAIRLEIQLKLQQILEGMDPIDREIIALRHYEELTYPEAAVVLGIGESAARKRYVGALKRLSTALKGTPGLLESAL